MRYHRCENPKCTNFAPEGQALCPACQRQRSTQLLTREPPCPDIPKTQCDRCGRDGTMSRISALPWRRIGASRYRLACMDRYYAIVYAVYDCRDWRWRWAVARGTRDGKKLRILEKATRPAHSQMRAEWYALRCIRDMLRLSRGYRLRKLVRPANPPETENE